jgi:diadenosine tetraphosphate (Ap4A) HIT family hydrolase
VALVHNPVRSPMNDEKLKCPFCQRLGDQIVDQNHVAVAFPDGYPVSDGHMLIVPRRHVRSIFDHAPPELNGVWALVAQVRARLLHELAPDGFTIGVNDGVTAGQTIGHGHIHVIPRRRGDVPDPRGGVRWVIPTKAAYWSA